MGACDGSANKPIFLRSSSSPVGHYILLSIYMRCRLFPVKFQWLEGIYCLLYLLFDVGDCRKSFAVAMSRQAVLLWVLRRRCWCAEPVSFCSSPERAVILFSNVQLFSFSDVQWSINYCLIFLLWNLQWDTALGLRAGIYSPWWASMVLLSSGLWFRWGLGPWLSRILL